MAARFSDEEIQHFFSGNREHPIHKRIIEIVEMLEGATASYMDYKLDDDGLSYNDGWIHAAISADYSDGDFGGIVHFTFPAKLLSLDDAGIIEWITRYKEFLDTREAR